MGIFIILHILPRFYAEAEFIYMKSHLNVNPLPDTEFLWEQSSISNG